MRSVKNLYWWFEMMDKVKRFFHKIQLKNKQKQINKIYHEEGLTSEVLEKQVQINKERNEFNITDEDEKIYMDFVQ